MSNAYVNRVRSAVPENEVHRFFLRFAAAQLADDPRRQAVFNRMSDKGGIEHRYSCLTPSDDPEGESLDAEGVYRRDGFPGTARRMDIFEDQAHRLATRAVAALDLGDDLSRITHLIVGTCTGFSAPGIDLEIVARCGLNPSVERTIIGFMEIGRAHV